MNIEVNKVKIHVTIPESHTEQVRKAHPYEEPAIDIVPLIDEGSLV